MKDSGKKVKNQNEEGVSRRVFLKASSCAIGAGLLSGAIPGLSRAVKRLPSLSPAPRKKKALVLGMDGMDPMLYRRFKRKGLLPNFQRLEAMGGFSELGTSIPPQSPVAWADFATGMDAGGHGIFDFIGFDRENLSARLTISDIKSPGRRLNLLGWSIPLGGGKPELLRKGKGFWNCLEEHDIRCRIIRLPANFPPEDSDAKTLSGIGTPDLLGTIGTYTCITDAPQFKGRKINGAEMRNIRMYKHTAVTSLKGPRNALKKGSPHLSCKVVIYRDAINDVAKIVLQDQTVFLRRGELSDWVPLRFSIAAGFATLKGICRFYLQAVHPYLLLYVSPIQMDPRDPALPITTPNGFSEELADAVGVFSTLGIGEDMRAFRDGVLDPGGYFKQSVSVMGEWKRLFRHELSSWEEGLLFFYFSSLDTNSHMFWWAMDQRHPAHEKQNEYEEAILFFYREMDGCLGEAMQSIGDEDTIVVLSDHGFSPYYYSFDLNRWLVENGYLKYYGSGENLYYIDWNHTRAFGLGFNGLYLNLAGRDRAGIVSPDDRDRLAAELTGRLMAERDPARGKPVITAVHDTGKCYGFTQGLADAPDLIVGYNREYRCSWENASGGISADHAVITANRTKWSGDHCMDPELLRGCFLSNRKIASNRPNLRDVTATVLDLYRIPRPKNVRGKNILLEEGANG